MARVCGKAEKSLELELESQLEKLVDITFQSPRA